MFLTNTCWCDVDSLFFLDVVFDRWVVVSPVFCCLLKLVCLSGRMSIERKLACFFDRMSIERKTGFNEADLWSKKNRSMAAYKGHLTKLEEGTTFLNNLEPGNLFHTSKVKLFKLRINS